ncbi:MAG: hypothetical protein KC477_14740 [Oceanospirillaceae bacterium]|nr:hypothetical protein [Oceanospirillaceae bacterium]
MNITVDTNSTTFGLNTVDNLVFATQPSDRTSFFSPYDALITSTWMSLSNNNLKTYYTLEGSFSYTESNALSGASGTVSSFLYLEYLGAGKGYDRVSFTDVSIDLNALLFSSEWSALLAGNDNITGGDNYDTLSGYSGNDTFTGGNGNDAITGGDGSDTAVYSGIRENYRLTEQDGIVTVSDRVGTEGTDTLTGIETLQFSDVVMSVTDIGIINNRVENNVLSIIVNQGVLGSDPILLSGLAETTVYSDGEISAHTISYGGNDFAYESVDALLTTVLRDGEFTDEFRAEIANYAPSASNITYQEAVSLVGVANIDGVLLSVAGADGNYVG